MAIDVIIPSGSQPDSGFDVVLPGGGSALLEFDVPSVKLGTVIFVALVRDQEVHCADDRWLKVVDGLGDGGRYLDAWIRVADGTQGAKVSFLSIEEQELQGGLATLKCATPGLIVEASAHAAFAAEAAPSSPSSPNVHAVNVAMCIWSADGVVDLTPPDGFEEIDSYSSAVVSGRSILVAWRTAGATGPVPAAVAASAPAATGRAFTLVLRDRPPIQPAVLIDLVPGNIGLLRTT